MKTYKIIGFSLILSSILVITGCSSNENHNSPTPTSTSIINSTVVSDQDRKQRKNISKTESEIYAELKKLDGAFYRSMFGRAITNEIIADYEKRNLLSVKIIRDTNNYKINISYDEGLLSTGGLTDFLKTIYRTAYHIAEKNKIFNPEIEFYINDKSLDSF